MLNNEASDEAAQRGTRRTLVRVLETMMRLAHPIMPFITEEIWQKVAPLAGKQTPTIMREPYPKSQPENINETVESEIEWVMAFILGIRKVKGEMNIAPGRQVPVILTSVSEQDQQRLSANEQYLKAVGKVASVAISEQTDIPDAAMTLLGEMQIHIPLEGLIDKEAEVARLTKSIGKIDKEITRLQGKVNNPGFYNKAPEAVVNKEREKLAVSESAKEELAAQLAKLSR